MSNLKKSVLSGIGLIVILMFLHATILSATTQPPASMLLDPENADGDGNYTLKWSDVSSPTAEMLSVSLPTGRYGTSAVWDGQYAYVFGGHYYDPSDYTTHYLDDIVRFDPSTGNVTLLSVSLPTGRSATSAVWDGQYAYIFGGIGGSSRTDIVRFDPATGNVTTLLASFPTGIRYTSAVWAGQNAYVFDGGMGGDNIVRFDPATGNVTTLSATLPTGRSYTSAVWDGQYAYVFGGDYGSCLDDIVRFDPATGNVTTLLASLPTGRSFTSAVWDGQYAYIFGGSGGLYYLDDIVRFDPSTGSVTTLSDALPTTGHTSTIWDGEHVYLFGGWDDSGGWDDLSRMDDIVRFDPGKVTYILEEDDNPDFTSPTQMYLGMNTNVSIQKQSEDVYYYRVNAANSDGASGWSNVVSVSVGLDGDGAPSPQGAFLNDPLLMVFLGLIIALGVSAIVWTMFVRTKKSS